jgi:hypothetical protein
LCVGTANGIKKRILSHGIVAFSPCIALTFIERRKKKGRGLIYAEVIFTKVVICKFKSLSE